MPVVGGDGVGGEARPTKKEVSEGETAGGDGEKVTPLLIVETFNI